MPNPIKQQDQDQSKPKPSKPIPIVKKPKPKYMWYPAGHCPDNPIRHLL